MMIIGITGTLGSGKSTIVEFLKDKGFNHFSARAVLIEEMQKRGVEINLKNMTDIANKLREEFGPSVLAQRMYEMAEKSNKPAIIESIRTVGEIELLRKKKDFILLAVVADRKIRYKRIQERKSEIDKISYEEFIEIEEKQMSSNNPNEQNLKKCIELSDYKIENNGTIQEFKKKIEDIILVKMSTKKRPAKDEYYINIAKQVAQRTNCLMINLGAIIVKGDQIISTGYVGAPRKIRDCIDSGMCLRRSLNIPSGQRYELCKSVHAEQNAIINAARAGVSLFEGVMYFYGEKIFECDEPELIDGLPCFICKKMIINAGIKTFVGMQSDGSIKRFEVADWVKEWQERDMHEDLEKYSVNYKKEDDNKK
jgi:dCMP deaminase